MILAEAATCLHSLPDTSAIMEGIADRLRVLLHSPVVLIFVEEEGSVDLRAVSSKTPALARVIRSRSETNHLRSAIEIAARDRPRPASGSRSASMAPHILATTRRPAC